MGTKRGSGMRTEDCEVKMKLNVDSPNYKFSCHVIGAICGGAQCRSAAVYPLNLRRFPFRFAGGSGSRRIKINTLRSRCSGRWMCGLQDGALRPAEASCTHFFLPFFVERIRHFLLLLLCFFFVALVAVFILLLPQQ